MQITNKITEWLTPSQACSYLNVGRTTLWKYRKQDLLKFYKHGRKILYLKQSLDDLLIKHSNCETNEL